MPWKMRPVTATARIRGRKMIVWTTTRDRGAINNAAAITSAMQTGTVRKIPVQMKLFVSADQNTGSSNICWKFASPAHTGVPTPSHMTNAAMKVSMAGIRMMKTLISSAGSANSHISPLRRCAEEAGEPCRPSLPG